MFRTSFSNFIFTCAIVPLFVSLYKLQINTDGLNFFLLLFGEKWVFFLINKISLNKRKPENKLKL